MIHDKLHQSPCGYANYEEFNGDVEAIFAQEKSLKSVRGKLKSTASKRMQCAVTTENYWNTLTASYRQYGFDAVVNYKPDPPSNDDSKEGDAADVDTNHNDTHSTRSKVDHKNNNNIESTTSIDKPPDKKSHPNSSSSDFDHDHDEAAHGGTHDADGNDGGRGRKQSAKKKLTLKATPSQSLLHNMKKRVLSAPSEPSRKRRKLENGVFVHSL